MHKAGSFPQQEFQDEIKKYHLRLALREDGQCVIGPASQEWAVFNT